MTSRLEAYLFLLHAPGVYDFRERDDMLLAYLSDSVNVGDRWCDDATVPVPRQMIEDDCVPTLG